MGPIQPTYKLTITGQDFEVMNATFDLFLKLGFEVHLGAINTQKEGLACASCRKRTRPAFLNEGCRGCHAPTWTGYEAINPDQDGE